MHPTGRDERPTPLDLPEGPRELFAAVEPVLSRHFTPGGYRIGGGTLLRPEFHWTADEIRDRVVSLCEAAAR